MFKINNLNELEKYGINLLTGEADRLSMRILCDLNSQGHTLVCDFLGLPLDTPMYPKMNSQVNGSPAVASMMLTRDTLWEIGRFALLTVENLDVVIEQPGYGMRGGNFDDKYTESYLKLAYAEGSGAHVWRNHAKTSTAPGSGSRNQHAMSGRTV